MLVTKCIFYIICTVFTLLKICRHSDVQFSFSVHDAGGVNAYEYTYAGHKPYTWDGSFVYRKHLWCVIYGFPIIHSERACVILLDGGPFRPTWQTAHNVTKMTDLFLVWATTVVRLTCWGLNKMVNILETTYSNAFDWQFDYIYWNFTKVRGHIDYNSALIQVMAWYRRGEISLPELMMTKFYEAIWSHQGQVS